MKNYVDTKILEVYNVALKLGLENASDYEKTIFMQSLRSIAVAAIDDVRKKAEDIMHYESDKYTKL